MKNFLFIDTSTAVCRLWLNDLSYERGLNRQMARDILSFISDILSENNLSPNDLGGIGVCQGAGSFTGLRIGATVANTLADGLNIPIVAVKKSDDYDWSEVAKNRLESGENDKMALPFYGAEANITKPRK